MYKDETVSSTCITLFRQGIKGWSSLIHLCVFLRGPRNNLNILVHLLFLLLVHFYFVHNGNGSVCWILGFWPFTELHRI